MGMRGTDHYQFVFVILHTFIVFHAERGYSRIIWVTEFEFPICFV